ncbi:lipopolysaccharide biosynthesis protein, partial [Paenibacillus sp. GCM10012303]|uniref:lipopolysaccharide biosynthesis protein n=1 Tax=Paenibacillus sp. GCM10012303 TaxID=3317340 RepID=UPI0036064EED
MSGKNNVLVNSGLYTISSVLVNAISFLLLPVYTMFLTPNDYGVTNLVSSFTNVASIIISFSLYSSVSRFYVDYKEDRERLKAFYGTIIIFILFTGLILMVLGVIFQRILIDFFFRGFTFYPILFICLLNMIFVCQYTIHQRMMQSMHQGKKYTIVNLTFFICAVCLNLLFIVVIKLGATGVLLATLIINI